MGRGGGSSGGSHGGGGGHFHYSGGRSGRSSGSSSRSRSSSTYHHHHHHYGYGYGGRVVVHASPAYTAVVLFIFVAILAIYVWSMSPGANITRSTIERTPLDSKYVTLTDIWYEDDLEWIHDQSKVEEGMRYFYEKTGVQPYLWITDNIEGDPRPNQSDFTRALQFKYQQLFSDEGHLILCFMESSPSDYATYYWAGAQAKNVVDVQGGEILLDYLDYYYTTDIDDDEFFARSFVKAADRMMQTGLTTKQMIVRGTSIALALLLILGILSALGYRSKKRKEAMEAAAKVLDAPMEELGNSVLEKYKGE